MKRFQHLACLLVVFIGFSTTAFAQPTQPLGWQGNVLFDLNSATLRASSIALLEQIADAMVQDPGIHALLTGHTDNTGNLEYNQRLSIQRTDAVMTYLVERGVAPARIYKRAVGEQRPVADNACKDDRERNRRVDIAFYPAHEPPPEFPEMIHGESQPEKQDSIDCVKR